MMMLINLDTDTKVVNDLGTTNVKQNNVINNTNTIYKGIQVDKNLHDINADYNNGLQVFGGLMNLDTDTKVVNDLGTTNVKQNNVTTNNNTIYKGIQVDKNLHDINADYNNGLQVFGGLVNLDTNSDFNSGLT